jgi:predicted RNA binding protein YcfA (HicA-like mRNA interferase family)
MPAWGLSYLQSRVQLTCGDTMSCQNGKVKVRDVLIRLRSDGWVQVRMKGSHRQFHHPKKPGTVTVAGKPGLEVPPGTLSNILKQASLK